MTDLAEPAALGVLLGLFFGKQIGVFGAVFIAVKARIADLPSGVSWKHMHGLSALAGIGFTMSLFLAGLAYQVGSAIHVQAKLGILAGSVLSAILGLIVLGNAKPPATRPVAPGQSV